MKSKRGTIEFSWELIAHLFFAIVLLIAIIWGVKTLTSIIDKRNQEAECLNDIYWKNPGGLKEILKKIDKGENANFFFDNENCNLVSFSFSQSITEDQVQYPHPLPREPLLCLCMIEDKICKPHACHTFKNYDQINSKQFSTEDLEKYVFLKFSRDGRTLRIDALGTEKPPEPKFYSRSENQELASKTDPAGLIHTLNILFETKDIEGFKPIVEQTGFFIPVGIEKVENFTMLFDIDLAQPQLPGQNLDDYITNYRKIDPEQVKVAVIILSIPDEKYSKLSSFQRENIKLYYKKQEEWKNIQLACENKEGEILCGARLNGFSSNFAISSVQEQNA